MIQLSLLTGDSRMSRSRDDFSRLITIIFVTTLMLISFLSVNTVSAQGGQVALNPTDDTSADSNNPNSNFGERDYLQVENYNSAINGYQTFEINQTSTWLKFNLSSIPEGAVIDAGTLQLFAFNVDFSLNINAYLGTDLLNTSAIASWTESTLTYSNMPIYNTTSLSSTLVDNVGQWYNWSVLNVIKNGNSTSGTITLVLFASPSWTSGVRFYSKESLVAQGAYSPSLVVHWSSVVSEFPKFIFLSCFTIALLIFVVLHKIEHIDKIRRVRR